MQPPEAHREPGAPASPPDAAPATHLPGGYPTADAALTVDTFRFTGLSWPARLLICLAVGVLVTATTWHLAASFLSVAPPNTLSEKYEDRLRGYVQPEFEQNWKLFAPNPLQTNVRVEVRAEILEEDGTRAVTDWIDLSERDVRRIEHNPFPSHTTQNQLRRAWEFYRNSLDDDGAPTGMRGDVAESYLHRLALLRIDQGDLVGVDVAELERIQLRAASTRVAAPPWSDEDIDTTTTYQELDWRTVVPADRPSGALLSAPGTDPAPARQGGDLP